MAFTEKYISTTYKAANPSDIRIVLSDDAYAICDQLDWLILNLNSLK